MQPLQTNKKSSGQRNCMGNKKLGVKTKYIYTKYKIMQPLQQELVRSSKKTDFGQSKKKMLAKKKNFHCLYIPVLFAAVERFSVSHMWDFLNPYSLALLVRDLNHANSTLFVKFKSLPIPKVKLF